MRFLVAACLIDHKQFLQAAWPLMPLFSQAMHKSDLRLFSNCISLGRRTCTLSCWNASRAAKQMRMLLEGEKSLTCNTRTSWETPKINQNQWCLPSNRQTSWIFGFFMGSSCLFCCFVLQPTSHQPATNLQCYPRNLGMRCIVGHDHLPARLRRTKHRHGHHTGAAWAQSPLWTMGIN